MDGSTGFGVGRLFQDNEELDAEEEYAVCAEMATSDGLQSLLRWLEKQARCLTCFVSPSACRLDSKYNAIRSCRLCDAWQDEFESELQLSALVLKLLFNCCKIKINKQKMMDLSALSMLLAKLRLAFASPSLLEIAEYLLMTVESVVQWIHVQQRSADPAAPMQSDGDTETPPLESLTELHQVVLSLTSAVTQSSGKLVALIAKILAHLCYADRRASAALLRHFGPFVDAEISEKAMEQDDITSVTMHQVHVSCFVKLVEALAPDELGAQMKLVLVEHGIVGAMVEYLQRTFPHDKTKESAEYSSGVERKGLPSVLQLLTAAARSCTTVQNSICQPGVLHALHQLEGMSTVSKVGTLVENLLEALKQGNPQVHMLYHARSLKPMHARTHVLKHSCLHVGHQAYTRTRTHTHTCVHAHMGTHAHVRMCACLTRHVFFWETGRRPDRGTA